MVNRRWLTLGIIGSSVLAVGIVLMVSRLFLPTFEGSLFQVLPFIIALWQNHTGYAIYLILQVGYGTSLTNFTGHALFNSGLTLLIIGAALAGIGWTFAFHEVFELELDHIKEMISIGLLIALIAIGTTLITTMDSGSLNTRLWILISLALADFFINV